MLFIFFPNNMAKKENKNISKTVKTVKEEAKEYYSWKNMTIRYVILWFLVLLLVLQFILPHKKNKKDTVEELNQETIATENTEEITLNFLWNEINLSKMDSDTKIKFDKIIKKSQSDIDYKYSLSQYYLPEIYEIFAKYKVPVEFSYIAILNDFQQPYWQMEKNLREYYGLIISTDVDETLNVKKVSEAVAMYFSDLYKKFKDWNLILIAYFMWSDKLWDEMDTQWVKEFEDLYITNDIKEKYLQIMAYSYIFQNLDEFINTDNLSLYEPKNTERISVSDIKDLVKRAKKNKYSYKEIKELNPRILWNSLPKWKREILVNN